MRVSRMVGLISTCIMVVTVLLASARPADSGPSVAPRPTGPASGASHVEATSTAPATPAPGAFPVEATSIAPATPASGASPVEASPTVPAAPGTAATSGGARESGSASRTLEDVDGPAHGQASTPRATTAGNLLFSESFAQLPGGTSWVDGTRYGAWESVYNGYGTTRVEVGESPVLSQFPKAATSSDVTHGALAVTTREYGDVDVTVRQRTVSQLRSPEPNAWEVPWALWAYTDDEHFYYLVLKPNGWELGKEDPAYPGAQRFLATGSSPTFPLGAWHTVRIRQNGTTIEVWGDGQLLTRFVDQERPYSSGHIGLYTEDAHVEHADLVVQRP